MRRHRSSRGSIARYSRRPFTNARKFKYIEKNGTEGYIYCDRIPERVSIFSLILHMITFLPFFVMGYFVVATNLYIFVPPKPLEPVYEKTDVHIDDRIGVIEDKNGLEDVLQQFEDTTGVSPYVVMVYDSEWQGKYDELLEYARYIYVNKFTDEQHFLLVYSEPEDAEGSKSVNSSWVRYSGKETDLIFTAANINRFKEDLDKNIKKNDISAGEAFQKTFEDSLTYMMEYNYKNDAVMTILFLLIFLFAILFFCASYIQEYKWGKKEYLEIPMDGASNMAPGAIGYGTNAAYQNGAAFQNGAAYQSNTTFQGYADYQGGQGYQGSQAYRSSAKNIKRYMYYDKRGNKRYISTALEPSKDAFVTMLIILIIVAGLMYNSIPTLWKVIIMMQEEVSVVEGMPGFDIFTFVTSLVWNLALLLTSLFAIRHYFVCKNRDYVDVTGTSTLYNEGMPDSAAQYNAGMQYTGTQYNAGMQNNASQYNAGMTNNGAADSNYYNDEARFRDPEYYDNDARYRSSTAYEAGKK